MIKNAVGNYSRQQILEVLNEISLITFSDNTMRVERIDPATGMPPLLTTVNNQRHYNQPADCRETAAIFVEDPQRQYTPLQEKALYTEYVWRGTRYYKVAVRSQAATIDQLATITFIDNPGATTDRYYNNYYIRHIPLTSETIQSAFPEEIHYLLRNGVIQMLKGESYSAGLGDVDPIERLASRIRNKLNKGAQARVNRTPWPEECRYGDAPGYR
jgi:hypothetical protein